MVLGSNRTSLAYLKDLHLGTVVWTLNIAYLLRDFGLENYFYTIQRKISANYETDIFSLQQNAPDKDIFHKALEIVKQREENAEKNGISVFERELSEDELKSSVMHGHVAIVLINSLFFGCLECHPSQFHEFSFCSLPVAGNPYRGHYITVCGYNPVLNIFCFKNPSSTKSLCFVPAKTLEHARKCFGTQQNIILIKMNDHSKLVNNNMTNKNGSSS